MAAYHGVDGKANFSSDLHKLQNWSAITTMNAVDTSGMGDDWITYDENGLTDFSVTAEGLAETTIDYCSLIGTDASLSLYINATNYFEGNAILTSLTETADQEGVGTLSYSFAGNDAAGLAYN